MFNTPPPYHLRITNNVCVVICVLLLLLCFCVVCGRRIHFFSYIAPRGAGDIFFCMFSTTPRGGALAPENFPPIKRPLSSP